MKKIIMVTATYQGERYNGSLDEVAELLLAKVGDKDKVYLRNATTRKVEWIVGPGKREYVPL